MTTLATGLPNATTVAAAYDAPGQRIFASVCCDDAGSAATVEVAVGGVVDLETKLVGLEPTLSPDGLRMARITSNSVVIRELATRAEESISFTESIPLDVLWKDDASVYVVAFSDSVQLPVLATYSLTGEQLALVVIETVPLDTSLLITFAGISTQGALSVLFDIESQSAQSLGFDVETLQPAGGPVDLGGPITSLSLSSSGQSLWVGADQTLHVGGGAPLPGQYRWAQWV